MCDVRAAKTTKEIEASELEQLTRPEARETAAFDAAELQGLLDQSRHDDDLAIPVERAVSSNVVSMPRASAFAVSPNAALAGSSKPAYASSSAEVPLATSPAFPSSSGELHASSRATTSPGASALIPMTTDFDDEPGHYSTAEPPPTPSARTLSAIPSRIARGSGGTPNAHPLTKPRTPSLLPWIIVALAAAVVIALAMWR